MRRILIVCTLGIVFTAICAAQTPAPQRGNGTWFKTDSKSLAASHATLPFGTRVRVTNLNNDKQVIVTITNRIPASSTRIIDMSQEPAKNIEMAATGTTPVLVEVLRVGRRGADEDEAPPPATDSSTEETPKVEEKKPEPPPPPPPPVEEKKPEPAPPPPPPVEEKKPEPAPPPPPAPVEKKAEPRNSVTNINITINGKEIIERVEAAPQPAPVYQQPEPPPPQFVPQAGAARILPRMPDPRSSANYRVQVGSFVYPLHAQAALERVRAAGFTAGYERYQDYIRVVIPGVRAADMSIIAQRLGAAGFTEVYIREER